MLQGGYFSISGGLSGSSSNNSTDNIYVDSEGNIIFAPFDPVYIDDENRVYLSDDEKNGRFYLEDGKIYVERLV